MEILQQKGIEEKVMNIMEGMNQMFTGSSGNNKYADILGFYIALRDKGETHEKAVSDLKQTIYTFQSIPR